MKRHIIKSEILNEDGSWVPRCGEISIEVRKILKEFIEKYKGDISLCSMELLIQQSLHMEIVMARLSEYTYED